MSVDSSEKELGINSMGDVVTCEDVKIVAERYKGDKFVRVLDYLIDEYSEEKLGYLGAHKRLKITLQGSNEDLPESVNFFVKLVPHDCKELADRLNSGLFFKEANLFKNIIPQLEKYCKSEKWCPTCYLSKENLIVMEDLRPKGYKLHNQIFDDLPALRSVLASLARFHSSSILTEAHLSRQLKKPVRLDEYYIRFSDCYNLTCALVEHFDYSSDKIRKAYDQMYHIVQPSEIHCNVICHGDLWNNNLMFADDLLLQKCILVDFQLLRYAPLVTDLLQVMHLNATRSIRQKYEKDLIQFYHSVLEETIESNDVTGNVKVPSLAEVLEGMESLRIFGVVVATVVLPMVLIDSKIATVHTKESVSNYSFIFGNRFAVTSAHMKENAFYKNVIEQVITELVEESEKLFN